MAEASPSPRSQPAAKTQAAPNGNTGVATPDIPPIDGEAKLNQNPFDQPGHAQPLFGKLSASDGIAARRPSVQFVPHVKVDSAGERSLSRRPAAKDTSIRRLSSPPPPTQFTQRVSFDTFDNKDASDFSLTLSRKHKEYVYTKRSRTFLCGTDANEYSDTALEWLLDELIDDGDEIVCLRVVEKDSKEAVKWAGGGASKEGRETGYRAEAHRMLERIQEKNQEDRHINLILEFSIGKVHETIQHMISIYEPAMLVVGTRGKSLSGFQGLMPGSVSKYCLQHSPVPVIVVRPSSKRDKKKRKRLKDPSRRGYRDILDKSEDVAEGGHLLDERHRFSVIGTDVLGELAKRDAAEEARMVAEAVGYNANAQAEGGDGPPLSRVISARSEQSNRSGRSGSFGSTAAESVGDPKSPTGILMKSPETNDLDSMPGSEQDDSDGEEDFAHVPAYVLAQEEALNKARERAIKAEEEEREAELERINRENGKPGKKKAKTSTTIDQSYEGAAGILNLLDDLKAEEKQRRKK